MTRFSPLAGVLACALAAGPALAQEVENPMTESETWEWLREDILGGASPETGDAVLALEAPYRAHDAATVPVTLTQTDPDAAIDSVTLVVDENPAPVVAEIDFAPAMLPLDFETRVRVDQYSNVRAIAETGDGLHMTGRFVKASGGCSAPATRDPDQALAAMGQMKVRYFSDASAQSQPRREAQVMIRHPNYSGLQRDQVSHLFIPAHFIDKLEVFQGDERLFGLTGGISISENPVFRFEYRDNGSTTLRIRAEDTEGNVFEEEIDKAAAS